MQLSHLCLADGLILQLPPDAKPPGSDTAFLCESVEWIEGASVLVVGCGAGLVPLVAARAGCNVMATDINSSACSSTLRNAQLNELDTQISVLQSDLFQDLEQRSFDMIVSNPPQLPTPPTHERQDWIGFANNGGTTGRDVLNRLVGEAPDHLSPGGKLVVLHLGILDIGTTLDTMKSRGFHPQVTNSLEKAAGALSFERRQYWDHENHASYTLSVIEAALD